MADQKSTISKLVENTMIRARNVAVAREWTGSQEAQRSGLSLYWLLTMRGESKCSLGGG